ncbi:pyruvate/2-oxoglutarate dehydrogenase complex, dihydrolipoamide acyltransferase component [Streptomyces venezuelae]|uniref:dihydrolipoamide acetyltransferase family protein n=1 Tax=Streptomyces gardneri TaxID=66892 RepID=UPI0006BD33EE|nr:dihydrolipoamide acetyltransferase family protein [Streptomyces gardneri]ALO12486.1 pyruvate/2-oxoglutarate dehydrogenase complex, dihydrolipoamide acyltransferase component [Streptomyces venezuelae]QPK49251.1 2-oxo acid dehydrogenase subunit E2 [Streptomyces gardneri]WRK40766.1 dihydrolipoamide acetyltransferase family protein [Streptomyces venezuelae]CUM36886.1 Dihydrolipoamide acetyltransferase component (E2) of acetoin dehydrogenase complex [Streptomyces venezuelae]
MAEFTMPSLGADMDEGTLSQWLVHPGDRVARGDVIAVVETAKSAIEVECFESGTVDTLLVDEGTTVPVGTPLARIGTTTESKPTPDRPPSTPLVRRLAQDRHVDLATVHGSGPGGRITRTDVEHAEPEPARAPEHGKTAGPAESTRTATGRQSGTEPERRKRSDSRPEEKTAPTTRPPKPVRSDDSTGERQAPQRVRSSPLARRLATELGVDLAEVTGTGRGGTVRADDVRSAAAAEGASRPTVPNVARAATARLMSRSKREIPHFYLSTTVDMAAALEWMRVRNRELPLSARLVPAALMLKAVALAARKVPELNGHWVDDGFVPAEDVRLGVAVSLRGGGLAAPSLAHADTLSVAEVMAALKDLVARARGGRLRASETADPSLTVTNLGDQGVEAVFGVVYPPQVALVGLGRIVERPVAVNGLLGVRPVVTATLSADHRAADGATGARLLTTMDRLLQQPEGL